MNFLFLFILLFIIWVLYGFFSSRVESAKYDILEKRKGYEIRLYHTQILAQTKVRGTYKNALNAGFSILAKYIFGYNTKKEEISMTSPVTEEKSFSESIAMTTPVVSNIDGEYRTISFGMPRKYNLNTLPKPLDSRVEIVSTPEKKMAAKNFSWFRTYNRVKLKKESLIRLLNRDNIKIIGDVKYAGYNAPWTPPFMIRNEVLVEVE